MNGKVIEQHELKRLFEKNKNIIDMVVERAKRDFPNDIALIGLTGSFATNDFHEKSDLDLIIVNSTDKGWGIAECFIFEGVGYDIYCTSWENLEKKAALECVGVSSLTDLQLIYHADAEALDRFNALREQALLKLAEPVGEACIRRAGKHIDLAKQAFANTMLHNTPGSVRYASCEVLYNLVNALVNLNNTCIKRGIKRYLDELLSYTYLPDDFEALYIAVIEANSIDTIRSSSLALLESVVRLYDAMSEKFIEKPIPSYSSLNGTYEELWCNCRNKVINSIEANDKSYAFYAAMGAQDYLDEMATNIGTKKFDLMKHFNVENLESFKDAFLVAMDDYLSEYGKVGRDVLIFDTFESLYSHYMGKL